MNGNFAWLTVKTHGSRVVIVIHIQSIYIMVDLSQLLINYTCGLEVDSEQDNMGWEDFEYWYKSHGTDEINDESRKKYLYWSERGAIKSIALLEVGVRFQHWMTIKKCFTLLKLFL